MGRRYFYYYFKGVGSMAEDEAVVEEEEKIPVSRREFLNLAWLASLGFFMVPFGGITLLFAYPRFKEGDFGGKFRISAGQLPEVGQSPIANPKGKFWLTRSEEGLRAIYKVCTHLGCLYAWQEQEFKFICPCHGSQFTYESEFIQGPAPRSLDVFEVEVIDGAGNSVEITADPNSAVTVLDDPGATYVVNTGAKINGSPVA
jgi:cytochrome b6-f complex iron-sulfur subunit